jgi:hypothetical protein
MEQQLPIQQDIDPVEELINQGPAAILVERIALHRQRVYTLETMPLAQAKEFLKPIDARLELLSTAAFRMTNSLFGLD